MSGYNINTFIFDYNDGYFLTDPKLFIKNHFPLDKKWLLIDNKSPLIEDFLNAPLIYGVTFKGKIFPVFPKKMKNNVSKNEEIIFQLFTKEVISLDKITIQIGENSSVLKTKPTSISKQKDIIFINYIFKIKGYYDVHLLYNKNVIGTYTFIVKN